jgi:Plasmid pRiA4b ORF-3-like protein
VSVKKNRAVYQFKVTLRNIHPPIWRRIQVWEDATLAQLHRVLQMAMGWEDYHLHEFRIGRKIYAVPDLDDERKIIDVKRTRIHDVIQQVGTEFEYVYDLGDYWEHVLVLEAILQPASDTLYPRCIAGERSCPPEDVGGSGGYEDYLEAMADPEHEEHEDMIGWRGPFDPEAFSVEKINRQLEKKFRPVRQKAVPATSHSASLLKTLLSGSAVPQKERIQIKANQTVPLELNERERELIQNTFADDDLTGRLRVVPKAGERPVFRFTLEDLDELAGYVASEANHAKNKKLKKEWDDLFDRIEAILDGYSDQDD